MDFLKNALQGLTALDQKQDARASLQELASQRVKKVVEKVWTPEQERILSCRDARMDVVALAGTGKTEILASYARRYASRSWVYVTSHKALADQVRRRMPKNVKVTTWSSLAYIKHGLRLQEKMHLRPHHHALHRVTGWKAFPQQNVAIAGLLRLRQAYVRSALSELNPIQLDPAWCGFAAQQPWWEDIGGLPGLTQGLQRVWSATLDPYSTDINAPFETPVKLLALSGEPWSKDGLLIDEAQDLDACILATLDRQSQCILVGDPYQSLDRWRGGGCWKPGPQAMGLTCSYRLGTEVAEVANMALEAQGSSWLLQGTKEDSALNVGAPDGKEQVVLATTQSAALMEAMARLHQGEEVRWLAPATLRKVKPLLDIGLLGQSKDPWLEGAKTLDQVEKMVRQHPEDKEWGVALGLVRRHGAENLSQAIHALEKPWSPGQVRVGTVYQAKGMALPHVRLSQEIMESSDPALLYVGMTRASHLSISCRPTNLKALEVETPIVVSPWETTDDGF